MSRFLLCLSALALLAGACQDDYNSSYTYSLYVNHNKPTVVMLPVIDNTDNTYQWDLSDELSSALYRRISQRNHIALVDIPKVRRHMKKMQDKQNPFSSDVTWVKDLFAGEEFVAFLELVEHEEVLHQNSQKTSDPTKCSGELNMTMRVRLLDLRSSVPKVILQELVHDTHFIPCAFTQENFYQVPWGDRSFNISPMGLAHAHFTKEIASRIEDYVLIMASAER